MSRLLFESQEYGRGQPAAHCSGAANSAVPCTGISTPGRVLAWTGDFNLDEIVQEGNGVVGHVSDDDEMR